MKFLELFTIAKLGKSDEKQMLRTLIVAFELIGLAFGGYKLIPWLIETRYFIPALEGLGVFIIALVIALGIVMKADGEL